MIVVVVIVVVIVVEMHGPRRAVAVVDTDHVLGHTGHVHGVVPDASHGERAVVGRRRGRVRGDGGVEAVEQTVRGGALGGALVRAHVRGAGHDVRGGSVGRNVPDVRQSQVAGGVIVAGHELGGAAGVLRSGESR